MAIVVDPDNLNRNEVIFGTTSQKLSAYPVGAVVSGVYDPELADGITASGFKFFSTTGQFLVADVAAGDVLSLKSGGDAGHWVVSGVISNTELAVLSIDNGESGAPSDWTDPGGSGVVYDIRESSGGNMADGASEQAVYSFSKEEWRSDSETYGSDNLIRHEFPFEPLTREQFEIGGGDSHDNWEWFSHDTRERIRTGGWGEVNSASTLQQTYAGVITLGDLDTDAQVYYQPSGTSYDPVNFVLTGAVNQAIRVYDVLDGYDTRTYLKLFVRKKGKTYDGSAISDIGVTTLENIVNRFPLTHADDPAITADDAEILGNESWTNFTTIDTGSNGITANVDGSTGTLTAAGENFLTSGVEAGDVVEITDGTDDNGFFVIVSVDSDTQLTLNTVEHGAFSGESTLTYETHTRYIEKYGTDGVAVAVTATSGTFTSASGSFGSTVAIGDMLIITEDNAGADPSGIRGVYKISAINSDTELGINTTDQEFPGAAQSNIYFNIVEPGMYLQQKNDEVTLGSIGDLQIYDTDPDQIKRQTGSWVTDGVTEGDVITLTGASNTANNSSFVVRTVTADTIAVDTQHSLTAESGSISASVATHFKRTINSVIYPFLWRLYGNDGTASECYEYVQYQLRLTSDIDNGPLSSRGDVTDLLMEYAAPVGKGLNMYIDDLNANDINNVTFDDASETNRAESFVAAGTINHNTNLVDDSGPAVVRMFFKTTPQGDFGTKNAIIVNDATGTPISYNVTGSSKSFTFDYDNNVQGGRSSSTNADVVIVAIGTDKAQYVLFEGTITRTTGLTFSLVSSLERTYST